MSSTKDVAVIIGSLRKESWSRKLALSMFGLASGDLKFEIVEIADVGLYNADLEEDPPKGWTVFRERIKRADAVLFVTPEYNRSVPGVLKNAIDVGSRPSKESAWFGKPGGIVSVTPGGLGAMAANHQLRQALVGVNVAAMPGPECYIAGVAGLFDESGKLNESTQGFLTKFMTAFEAWISANAVR